MKVFRSFFLPENLKNSVIAIGNFDGLHKGHLQVINKALEISENKKLKVGVMTFEPHPKSYFSQRYDFFRLTPFRSKYELLKKMKIDFLLSIRFDEKLVKISAKEFLEKILTDKLKVNHVVTGFDFVFGNNQLGDVKLIRGYCKTNKTFDFSEVSELRENNLEVSSSLVRNYLRKGNIEHANNILSRKWEVTSRVVSGEKKARMLGFRTANLKINNYCDLKFGVYAVKVTFLKKFTKKNLYGIANYGVKPTFKKKYPILEIHIFNFNEEIYGKKIKVSFINFIRSEKKFESIEKLKDQIIKDINSVKNNELFKNN
mgnify:CR=1 FL=1